MKDKEGLVNENGRSELGGRKFREHFHTVKIFLFVQFTMFIVCSIHYVHSCSNPMNPLMHDLDSRVKK